uniref:Uncharacterized protein n=2 Tax=Viruses TaxID=10239 RepID=A0AAU8GNY0_9CAUD
MVSKVATMYWSTFRISGLDSPLLAIFLPANPLDIQN